MHSTKMTILKKELNCVIICYILSKTRNIEINLTQYMFIILLRLLKIFFHILITIDFC